MRFAFESDKGKVRELNEDSCKVIIGKNGVPDTFIIADGMGGHNSGEVASRIAVEFAQEYLQNNAESFTEEENILSEIEKLMEAANSTVYQKSKESEENAGMGTTFVVTVIFNSKFYIGHVGDSRVYLIREGKIEQLTTDHSFIEELIKNGSLTREEAENHPKKNIITRALGCEENILIDTLSIGVNKNDTFVLCTDGLSNMLTGDEILSVIANNDDINVSCGELVRLANEKGGEDNITVIIIKND